MKFLFLIATDLTVVKIFVGKTLLICCDGALAAVGKGVADGTEVEYV